MAKIELWLKQLVYYEKQELTFEVPRVPAVGEFFTYRHLHNGSNRTGRVVAVFIHSTHEGGINSEVEATIYVEVCEYPFRSPDSPDKPLRRVSIPKDWR